jgi:hypothetical protein
MIKQIVSNRLRFKHDLVSTIVLHVRPSRSLIRRVLTQSCRSPFIVIRIIIIRIIEVTGSAINRDLPSQVSHLAFDECHGLILSLELQCLEIYVVQKKVGALLVEVLVIASHSLRESEYDGLELTGRVFALDLLDDDCICYLGAFARAVRAVKEVKNDSRFAIPNARAISKKSCSDALVPDVAYIVNRLEDRHAFHHFLSDNYISLMDQHAVVVLGLLKIEEQLFIG